jgi:hypothetical protein
MRRRSGITDDQGKRLSPKIRRQPDLDDETDWLIVAPICDICDFRSLAMMRAQCLSGRKSLSLFRFNIMLVYSFALEPLGEGGQNV